MTDASGIVLDFSVLYSVISSLVISINKGDTM